MPGVDLPPPRNSSGDQGVPSVPWFRLLNRYHWFVLVVAALGWLFDCFDQQLFVLARPAAMAELIQNDQPELVQTPGELKAAVSRRSGHVTAIFLMGWAVGGLIFGVIGDRYGRAKTMVITILLYSAFTGLSSISQGFVDFAIYRFLTGLGVGGEFAVGVALVAEVMPDRARPYCLMILQMLSAVGNVAAALVNMSMGVLEEHGLVDSPWRVLFIVGALPALLTLIIRARLKEPERWQKMRQNKAVSHRLGSYRELFGDPTWRRHAIGGLILAFSGVVGLWAVGFFAPDLTRAVLREQVRKQVYETEIMAAQEAANSDLVAWLEESRKLESVATPDASQPEAKKRIDDSINGRLTFWSGVTSIMLQIGAFFGMFGFGMVAQRIGRRPTFALGFVAAGLSTAAVFWFLDDFGQLFWMMPIMGFCQLSLFAGYAMYFPELFPTHLRSTGTSFCYNVGRFVAASGPFIQGELNAFFSDTPEPLRYAGVTMCSVFLVGLLVLPFLPETRGKPLPE